MTLDDQLRALAPLDPKQIGSLAGYSSRGNQLAAYRARGSKIPDDRLEELARGLELLAGIARSLKARQPDYPFDTTASRDRLSARQAGAIIDIQ